MAGSSIPIGFRSPLGRPRFAQDARCLQVPVSRIDLRIRWTAERSILVRFGVCSCDPSLFNGVGACVTVEALRRGSRFIPQP